MLCPLWLRLSLSLSFRIRSKIRLHRIVWANPWGLHNPLNELNINAAKGNAHYQETAEVWLEGSKCVNSGSPVVARDNSLEQSEQEWYLQLKSLEDHFQETIKRHEIENLPRMQTKNSNTIPSFTMTLIIGDILKSWLTEADEQMQPW